MVQSREYLENDMKIKPPIVVLTLFFCAVSVADESFMSAYENLVDDAGNITLPDNFRTDWMK